MSKRLAVYVWQAPGSTLPAFPAEFVVYPVRTLDALPPAPLLVPADQWETFAEAIEATAARQLPLALLYLSAAAAPPPSPELYFDATIREGDWEALRQHLQAPALLQVGEWAAILQADVLDELPRPLLRASLDSLPLPEAARAALRDDDTLWAAFAEAIEREQYLRRATTPSLRMLADFVRGKLSAPEAAHVEAYLTTSPSAQAKVALLRREFARQPAPAPHLTVPLRRDVPELFNVDKGQVVFVLMMAMLRVHVHPARRGSVRKVPGLLSEEAKQLVDALRQGRMVTLSRGALEVKVSLGEDDTVEFHALRLRDGEPAPVFYVRMDRAETTLWQGRSIDGMLALPQEVLYDALIQGADQIEISAA